MRVRLRHDIVFAWERPVKSVLQSLRVTPRDHEAQHVIDWRIGTDVDCRLSAGEDAFGNITHSLSAEGSLDSLTINLEGLVLTSDIAGVIRRGVERFPPELYLRDTSLTACDGDLRAFADEVTTASGGPLDRLHRLMAAVHETVSYGEGDPEAGAGTAFAVKHGTLADNVHVLIACVRHVGIPARYVAGYLVDEGRAAPHCWMEGHVEGLGWVGFDPLLDLCPQEAHIRVAMGLDVLGASPWRSAPAGGAAETVTSRVTVTAQPDKAEPAARQSQSQSQD
jgi:transglutaminase-like putative cysteine protease